MDFTRDCASVMPDRKDHITNKYEMPKGYHIGFMHGTEIFEINMDNLIAFSYFKFAWRQCSMTFLLLFFLLIVSCPRCPNNNLSQVICNDNDYNYNDSYYNHLIVIVNESSFVALRSCSEEFKENAHRQVINYFQYGQNTKPHTKSKQTSSIGFLIVTKYPVIRWLNNKLERFLD